MHRRKIYSKKVPRAAQCQQTCIIFFNLLILAEIGSLQTYLRITGSAFFYARRHPTPAGRTHRTVRHSAGLSANCDDRVAGAPCPHRARRSTLLTSSLQVSPFRCQVKGFTSSRQHVSTPSGTSWRSAGTAVLEDDPKLAEPRRECRVLWPAIRGRGCRSFPTLMSGHTALRFQS